jgi:hydrogenase-4 component F
VNLIVLTLAVPLTTAAIGGLGGHRRHRDAVLLGGLGLTFALCLALAATFLGGTTPTAFGEVLRVDALSALVVVLCGFVSLLSGFYAIGYLRRNDARGLVTPRMRREFHGLIPAYVFALLFVAVCNNLGMLWIAVELTTLASVFLVGVHNRDTSLEAAWKFLMLGSLGLGFALLGTILIYASGEGRLDETMAALNWTRLMDAAPQLHRFTLRLGVVFALIGYGTKAGLAPMHTWKPDAYREAPSPAGMLMAVGMLNSALYSLIRIHLISRAAMGPEFSGGLLLALGLLSVLVAVPFILLQWNLKRLLAYSSIEHAGIIAIGVGLGSPAGAFGALLHMTYHSFAKPLAFISAGTIAQLHTSSDLKAIGPGTLGRTPVASGLLLVAAIMVTGSPPFGLFFSEMTILRAGFSSPHWLAAMVFLGALVVLFCGFAYQIGHLVLGPQPDGPSREVDHETLDMGMGAALAAAGVAVVSAFYLPGPLLALIHAAVQVVAGGGQ